MRKGMVLGFVVLSLIGFLSSEVLAQGGKIAVGNLKIIPSLTLEEVYDDNIYLGSGINDTDERVESDWISHVMPGLALDYTLEGRGYLRVGYLGDYAYYKDFDDNDWKNHRGFLDFDYQAPGGLIFGVRNVYVDAADPYGSDNQYGLGVPQIPNPQVTAALQGVIQGQAGHDMEDPVGLDFFVGVVDPAPQVDVVVIDFL